jgi:hypothetical protein
MSVYWAKKVYRKEKQVAIIDDRRTIYERERIE